MAFPSTARNGQTHNEFGKKFSYSEASGAWSPAVPLASVAEVRIREKVAETATASYATAVELPLTGNTAGQMAFVQETNRLYVWSGTGWYNVATVTSAAAAISGANPTYTLATDGTPTVVTLSQSGLTSPTWSYAVTSSSLGRTATVTQADNIFTITPSALAKNVGSFGLTFKATDGSNTIAYSSQFTMSNTAPVIGTAPSAAYALASDGTPTIITLAATDADGHAITWSYEVVSGSLGGTAVSIVGSVFTITPSVATIDAGEFQLRFIASDGASFDAEVSSFTLSFGPSWDNAILSRTLNNPNTSSGTFDEFGGAVAISGERVIVGASNNQINGTSTGQAFIFNAITGSLLYTLVGSYQGNFGHAVAIDGNNACISAILDGSGGTGYKGGRVYIYNVTTGAQLIAINNPTAYGTSDSDIFGSSVGISGNYIIVGALGEDDAGGTEAGKAYIFNVATGALLHTLDNPNPYGTSAIDYFGSSVAISGNYAIVGAQYEDDASGTEAGKAYIYNVTTGALVHTLDDPNAYGTSASDLFGFSVSIDGNYAVVSATYESDAGGGSSGKAYIFNVTTGALLHTLDNPTAYGTSSGDNFAYSVSISGDYAVIGARAEDDGGTGLGAQGGTGIQSGKAYIFNVTTGTLVRTLDNPNAYGTSYTDLFGDAVAISGDYAIIGAQNSDDASGDSSGAAYIYKTSL
jgi:hypothetical protein